MDALEETLGAVTYRVTRSKDLTRHWTDTATRTTLCGVRCNTTSHMGRYPDCVTCKAAMAALRDGAHREALAASAEQWGFDANGSRYVVIDGETRQHLLRSGESTTLCGQPAYRVVERPDAAPNCRRCLHSIGRTLHSTPLNDRLELIAELAVNTIIEHVEVHVIRVPGDQMERLRKAIRRNMRQRNLSVNTWVVEGQLTAGSSDVYNAIPEDVRDRQVAEVLEGIIEGRRVSAARTVDNVIDWTTWAL